MASLPETLGVLERNGVIRAASRAVRLAEVSALPAELAEALRVMGLLASHDVPRATLLSEKSLARVYRVELSWGKVCIKQHFVSDTPAADARERARVECAWFHYANSIVPGAAPATVGTAPRYAAFATEYLDQADFPSWQSELAAGQVKPWTAAEAGHLLGRLHGRSAGSTILQKQFAGRAAPLAFAPRSRVPAAVAARVRELDRELGAARLALVHGAFNPDNLLVGPRGPVLIDADRAHYGDPILDASSCLAAIALRMVGHCRLRGDLAAAFDAFVGSYFGHVTWERPEEAENRAATLVSVLLLAGIDHGASPLADTSRAREAAYTLLLNRRPRLAELTSRWLTILGES
jgi:hypothetical protein